MEQYAAASPKDAGEGGRADPDTGLEGTVLDSSPSSGRRARNSAALLSLSRACLGKKGGGFCACCSLGFWISDSC
jgi:hypothetical protein